MVVNGVQESMLRQLFLKQLSATAVRSDPHDAAGPSTPGFDFGGGSCGGAGDAPPSVHSLHGFQEEEGRTRKPRLPFCAQR